MKKKTTFFRYPIHITTSSIQNNKQNSLKNQPLSVLKEPIRVEVTVSKTKNTSLQYQENSKP